MSRLGLPALGAALLAAACVSSREVMDPTILVHAPDGTELGASTTFGTVFLGRYARGGEIDLTAFFGDGPSLETSVVEPIGAGLFTAETEIDLPAVPLAFDDPPEGTSVLVRGRVGSEVWEIEAEVREDERVEGLLLRPWAGLTGDPSQVGAGVYLDGDDPERMRLLGLVTGRVRLIDAAGEARDYVTVVGPRDLWRLVAHRRDLSRKPRWVYREDVL